MILAVLALLLPAAAAWVWLDVLRVRAALGSAVVSLAVSFALGLGASSLSTTWLLLAGVPGGFRLAMDDAVLWIAVGLLGWWLCRRRDVPPVLRKPRRPLTAIDWAVRIGFAAVALVAVATAVGEYAASSHGQWDAWAMWNQKARFIIRGGSGWTDALTIPWAQPSHPLLVSTSVARLWMYAGAELTALPALLHFLIGTAIVAAVMGALDLDRRRAWIAGAVLLAPATFIREVMSQQADIPVGMFMALTAVVLKKDVPAEWRSSDAARAALLVAGALAGLGAWAKNEGVLFLGMTSLLVVWVAIRHAGWRPLIWWASGLAPGVATVLAFKRMVPLTPLYFSADATSGSLMERALSTDVHGLIVNTIGPRWHTWGGPLADGALPLAVCCGLLMALRPSGHSARAAAGAAMLMLSTFYVVWVLSPLDTAWLVNTTFDRLTAQLWPLFVLASFSWPVRPQPGGGSSPTALPAS